MIAGVFTVPTMMARFEKVTLMHHCRVIEAGLFRLPPVPATGRVLHKGSDDVVPRAAVGPGGAHAFQSVDPTTLKTANCLHVDLVAGQRCWLVKTQFYKSLRQAGTCGQSSAIRTAPCSPRTPQSYVGTVGLAWVGAIRCSDGCYDNSNWSSSAVQYLWQPC